MRIHAITDAFQPASELVAVRRWDAESHVYLQRGKAGRRNHCTEAVAYQRLVRLHLARELTAVPNSK